MGREGVQGRARGGRILLGPVGGARDGCGRPAVCHRVGKVHGRRGEARVVAVEARLHGHKILAEALILARVVAGGALRVIVGAEAPGEAVVQTLAQPVQLVGEIRVGAVIHPKQVAIGREGQVVGVAHATGIHIGGIFGLVILQPNVGGVGGDAKDARGEGALACPREAAIVGLHLAVVAARAAVKEDPGAVGAYHHAIEEMVELRAADRVGRRLGHCTPASPVANRRAAPQQALVAGAAGLVGNHVEQAIGAEGHAGGRGVADHRLDGQGGRKGAGGQVDAAQAGAGAQHVELAVHGVLG